MYVHGSDYLTVWKLAHIWLGQDSEATDPNNLSVELKESIHRILIAIRNTKLTVRSTRMVIPLEDDSFLGMFFVLKHDLRINACLRKNRFDKKYLDSLYVWRPEVLRWCAQDQLPVPSVWRDQPYTTEVEDVPTDQGWHDSLTPRRKGITTALRIAARLWEENPSLKYNEVYEHPDMLKYDKPRYFNSLEHFKEWARDIAPEEAKLPGRQKKTKY